MGTCRPEVDVVNGHAPTRPDPANFRVVLFRDQRRLPEEWFVKRTIMPVSQTGSLCPTTLQMEGDRAFGGFRCRSPRLSPAPAER